MSGPAPLPGSSASSGEALLSHGAALLVPVALGPGQSVEGACLGCLLACCRGPTPGELWAVHWQEACEGLRALPSLQLLLSAVGVILSGLRQAETSCPTGQGVVRAPEPHSLGQLFSPRPLHLLWVCYSRPQTRLTSLPESL